MGNLIRLSFNGRPSLIGVNITPQSPIAPSQVGSLAAGTPGTVTIPVTYTAASGTAPISYTGQYRMHGATAWLSNNGTFGATGGTFMGLTAASTYDLRIVATNTAGTSNTDLLTGITTGSAPPVVVPASSGKASRFDVILNQATAAPGATVTGGLYPNAGNWSGGTVTLTRASGTTIPVSLPSTGNAAVTFSFSAGSAGEEALTATNTVTGLRNPLPALLTVFAATTGANVALSIGSLPDSYRQQRVFQQKVWSGTPGGFAAANGATLGRGWGRVALPITPASPIQGVFARLTDADSAGATASGGGTAITNVAQVYGPTGGGNLALILPASDYCVYLDLAADAAFTSPVRVPFRFFIRDVCLVVTRSAENMLWGSFAEGIPGNTNWSSYQKVTGLGSQNQGNLGFETDNGGWGRADGSHTFGNYGQNYCGVGGQELGRMFAARKGTGLGILGLVPAGGDMDTFWAADGTPCNSAQALMAAADNEVRYVAYESAGWSNATTGESTSEYQKRHTALCQWFFTNRPSVAVISGNGDSGLWGSNGSQGDGPNYGPGFARQNQCVRNIELTDPAVVAQDAGADWNDYYANSGHASWASAVRYARARARSLLLAESPVAGGWGRGYADRFTTLTTSGTLANNVITIPFQLAAGATKVVALRWSNSVSGATWAYTTPSATDLRQLVAVYNGANAKITPVNGSYPASQLAQVTGVAVDNTTSPPTLKIAVAAGTTGPLTVQFLCDYDRYDTQDLTWWCGFFDDRDLGDGCGYGPGVRGQIDIAVS